MAQFDVYENPHPASRKEIPFLLDLQTDLLDGLATRVVAPLLRASADEKVAQNLSPRFIVQQMEVVISTPELAGIPVRMLGEKIGSLSKNRDEIIAALDFLFTGY